MAVSRAAAVSDVCVCRPSSRVDNERIVTNRPLAGTRRRGATPEADKALEQDLLADQKEVCLADRPGSNLGLLAVGL